jgi:hypothetical protein
MNRWMEDKEHTKSKKHGTRQKLNIPNEST